MKIFHQTIYEVILALLLWKPDTTEFFVFLYFFYKLRKSSRNETFFIETS